ACAVSRGPRNEKADDQSAFPAKIHANVPPIANRNQPIPESIPPNRITSRVESGRLRGAGRMDVEFMPANLIRMEQGSGQRQNPEFERLINANRREFHKRKRSKQRILPCFVVFVGFCRTSAEERGSGKFPLVLLRPPLGTQAGGLGVQLLSLRSADDLPP